MGCLLVFIFTSFVFVCYFKNEDAAFLIAAFHLGVLKSLHHSISRRSFSDFQVIIN